MENKERRKKRLRLGWILRGEVGVERKQRETQEAEKNGEREIEKGMREVEGDKDSKCSHLFGQPKVFYFILK